MLARMILSRAGRAAPYAVFAVLLLAISFSSMSRKGSAFDEGVHLSAGYTHLAHGFRMDPNTPPLTNMISALPLLWLRPAVDLHDETLNGGRAWHFASKFLYRWNDADTLLFWGRVPVVLLSLVLGVCVGLCARALYGWKAGCAALAMYLLNPELLAQGQIIGTDFGLACFLFLAVTAFYGALRHMTPLRMAWAGLAAGLPLVAKFSGILILPMLVLTGVAFALSSTPIIFFGRTLSSPGRKLAAMALLLAACLVLGIAVIWLCYGLDYRISPYLDFSQTTDWERFRSQHPVLTNVMQTLSVWKILPEAYGIGIIRIRALTLGGQDAFLLGRHAVQGWWYYFPIAFLIKTPIPLLLLIALGIALIPRYGAGLAAEAMLLLPVAIFTAAALSGNFNVGLRHMLPVLPFLIVLASKTARAFDNPTRSRTLAFACAALISWNAWETARIYPDFLSYFNQLAGGPSSGHRWLADSNIDWGQDLKGLAEYQKDHPEEPLYLCYFGTGIPEYYGIRAIHLPSPSDNLRFDFLKEEQFSSFEDVPPSATVAVSVTNLQCVYASDQTIPGFGSFMSRLRHLEPIALIGHSIRVYRLPEK